jgi:iron complex transport system permease protein
MKITLDISRLVEEGKLTRQEADKLMALAAHDTGSLGINILIGFGVVAIAAGAVALVPTPFTAVGLGLVLFAAGCAIALNRVHQWILLGQICLVIGALMFGGGVIAYRSDSLAAMLRHRRVLARGCCRPLQPVDGPGGAGGFCLPRCAHRL